MLRMSNGSIEVSKLGADTSQYKSLSKKYSRKKKFFKELMCYIFLMYFKGDSNLANIYRGHAELERSGNVIRDRDLFKSYMSDNGLDIDDTHDSLMQCDAIFEFVEFYQSIQYSENELTAESFRTKCNHYRRLLKNLENTTKEDLDYTKALRDCMAMYEDYKMKSEAEEVDSQIGGLYLFEDPEYNKPQYLKL